MATGSYLTPTYSRSQSEVQGDLHKTDWNCTRKSIFTCFAQMSDRLPRLTQTYPIMPDVMDMIESDID
ncbi:hypothetical protein TNCV_2823541 [Trichonephila clavipes]|nr:hypothetical protein TNCV_2823541 [Trichonephila clavipes]